MFSQLLLLCERIVERLDTVLVLLSLMVTIDVILTVVGLRILQKINEDAQAIAAMSKTTLDAMARLLALDRR